MTVLAVAIVEPCPQVRFWTFICKSYLNPGQYLCSGYKPGSSKPSVASLSLWNLKRPSCLGRGGVPPESLESEISLLKVSKQRKRRQRGLGIGSNQNVLANTLMAGEEAGVPDCSLMPSPGQDACGCRSAVPWFLLQQKYTYVSLICFRDCHVLSF